MGGDARPCRAAAGVLQGPGAHPSPEPTPHHPTPPQDGRRGWVESLLGTSIPIQRRPRPGRDQSGSARPGPGPGRVPIRRGEAALGGGGWGAPPPPSTAPRLIRGRRRGPSYVSEPAAGRGRGAGATRPRGGSAGRFGPTQCEGDRTDGAGPSVGGPGPRGLDGGWCVGLRFLLRWHLVPAAIPRRHRLLRRALRLFARACVWGGVRCAIECKCPPFESRNRIDWTARPGPARPGPARPDPCWVQPSCHHGQCEPVLRRYPAWDASANEAPCTGYTDTPKSRTTLG
jgi:hypothetical protein